MAGGQAEHQFAAGDVGFDGFHRSLDDALDAHGGGQVIDEFAAADERGDQLEVENGVVVKGEAGVSQEMGNVFFRAGGEVVDDGNNVPLAQQRIRKVRADEAGPARNENAHPRSFSDSL